MGAVANMSNIDCHRCPRLGDFLSRRHLWTFVCICKYKFPTLRGCVSPQADRTLNAAEALGDAHVLPAARCFNFECVVTFPGQLVFSPCSFYCRGTAAQHTTHNSSRTVGCSHAPPPPSPHPPHRRTHILSYFWDIYSRSLHSPSLQNWNRACRAGLEVSPDPNDGQRVDVCSAPQLKM